MSQKKHTTEEIVAKLRQVDVLLSQGRPVAEETRDSETSAPRSPSLLHRSRHDMVGRVQEAGVPRAGAAPLYTEKSGERTGRRCGAHLRHRRGGDPVRVEQAVLMLPDFQAALPFLSLGNVVGYRREYITRAPWILLSPAVVIVLTTLAVSSLGDWLRDRLDPTTR